MIPQNLPNARWKIFRLFLRQGISWDRVRASSTPPKGRANLQGVSPNSLLPKCEQISKMITTDESKRLPLNPQLDLLPPPFPTLGKRGNGMTVVPRGITGHLTVRAKAREAKGIITAANMKKEVVIVTILTQSK